MVTLAFNVILDLFYNIKIIESLYTPLASELAVDSVVVSVKRIDNLISHKGIAEQCMLFTVCLLRLREPHCLYLCLINELNPIVEECHCSFI